MLEIRTTDEFAAWFDALEDGPAEDVATALELIEKLGPQRVAPGSSEWLLWFEHPDAPELVVLDDWADFRESTKEMVEQLESPAFAEKLKVLPREEARRVMLAVETVKMASSARRRGLALMVAEVAKGRGERDASSALHDAYQAVAAVAGLTVGDHAVHSSALRELTVRSPAARSRILYGVDVSRGVALVVFGERLDRSFYGDSVRRAERIWKEFLKSQTEARDPAPR